MHIHYLALELVLRFQRRLDMLPEYMPSESRKWCWMAQYIYTYSKNIRSNTHNHIIKSLFAMDMDIDLESSPSTAAPSCCSRCKQQCFQDTTSIALTASHHFLTIFNNNHYIPLHTITYHYYAATSICSLWILVENCETKCTVTIRDPSTVQELHFVWTESEELMLEFAEIVPFYGNMGRPQVSLIKICEMPIHWNFGQC